MESERLVIEIACVALLLLMVAAFHMAFNFGAVLPGKGQSPVVQMVAFAGVPLMVYGASRALFTGWISGMNRMMDKLGKLPDYLEGYVGWLRTSAALFIMILGIRVFELVFPGIRQLLLDIYDELLGDLPRMIWEQTKGDREKAVERGTRVLLLVAAWFAFFYLFELLIRGVLWGVMSAIRLIMRGRMKGLEKLEMTTDGVGEEVEKETEPTPPDSDDEPEEQ